MEKGKSEMEISGVGGVGHSALEYAAIPAFQDNYIWVISNGRDAVVIDPGDEAPVRAYLRAAFAIKRYSTDSSSWRSYRRRACAGGGAGYSGLRPGLREHSRRDASREGKEHRANQNAGVALFRAGGAGAYAGTYCFFASGFA